MRTVARAVCTWLLVVLSAWSERLDAVYEHPIVNVDPSGERSCGGTAKPEWKVSAPNTHQCRPHMHLTCIICPSERAPVWLLSFQIYDDGTLSIDIDSSECKFDKVPIYVVSIEDGRFGETLVEEDREKAMPGSLTVAHSSASSFQVFMWDPKRKSGRLLDAAIKHNWILSWIGETGTNSGTTVPGRSGWKKGPFENVITVDVDTSAAKFAGTPRYFASMQGFKATEFGPEVQKANVEFWHTMGASTIYNPTAAGFRIYVTAIKSTSNHELVSLAEKMSWTISWVGVSAVRSGESDANWRRVPSSAEFSGDMQTDVTLHTTMRRVPAYVFSVSVMGSDYAFIGPGMIEAMLPGGFTVVVADIHRWDNSHFEGSNAKQHRWRVNYFVAHPLSAARKRKSKTPETVSVHARMRGERLKTFTVHKQHQLSTGLAAGLQVPLSDVHMLRATDWSEGVIVEYEVIAADKQEAADVCNAFAKHDFSTKVTHLMDAMGLFDPSELRFSHPIVKKKKTSISMGTVGEDVVDSLVGVVIMLTLVSGILFAVVKAGR
jgi:hypothetical protein